MEWARSVEWARPLELVRLWESAVSLEPARLSGPGSPWLVPVWLLVWSFGETEPRYPELVGSSGSPRRPAAERRWSVVR